VSQAANGLFKLTVYLKPDQYLWLHAVALTDAVEKGGGRPDASKLIRDMIDEVRPRLDAALAAKKKPRRRK